jgi:3-hydroxybutyryl-CoA dehydrogenase
MKTDTIRQISVIGAGLMGHGIAQEFAVAGYEVHAHDVSDDRLQKARENIRTNLRMLTEIGLVTQEQARSAQRNIHYSTVLEEAVTETDLVIEAVSEDLEVKRKVFNLLDQLCPPRTIFASNTSSLLPSKLASATHRPDKVLVAHYFNPPYLLPLVEVVRGEKTSDETIAAVFDLLTRVGKSPVIVQKEIPGFIGNRLQAALFREAISIVEKGIASPQDVDIVIKNSFGRRLAAAGIFEVWEIAGWDLILAIVENLIPDLESSTEISALLKEKVQRGELGTKTGKGFYAWTPELAEGLKQRIAQTLVKIAQQRRMS